MGIAEKLLKAENRIRRHIDGLFGDGASRTPLEVRHEILEQVASRISVDRGGRTFPFARILVRLKPPDAATRDVFQAAFLQDRSLERDIRETLHEAEVSVPAALEIEVLPASPDEALPSTEEPLYEVEFFTASSRQARERPAARLVVLKGMAEQNSYPAVKDALLIGRLAELMDREGQMTRRNDVVFLDNGDEINSTIGRAHATVFYDHGRKEYRIRDEVSRYGTRIFRAGRSIEVPGGNLRGIRLCSGDEIYVGRGCLRFEILEE